MIHLARRTMPATAVLALGALALAACSSQDTNGQGSETVPSDLPTDVTKINGSSPPGEPTRTKSSDIVLDVASPDDQKTIVFRSVREPKTRSPFHQHPYGGSTCIVRGEMTLYAEGQDPQTAGPGECYWMPPNTTVSGVNSGDETAEIYDSFTVPRDAPEVWYVVEKNHGGDQGELEVQGWH